ncbi:MAG: polyphosphate polymerase domain-containing protein [Firmicutes bacterium]|nr:polyphosphate polymerase domain-containing protein [Bacillota bacterium]
MKDFFTRTEVKYMMDEVTHRSLMADIIPHLVHDKYHHQRIHNVYYDNDTDDIIRHSISKPVFKEKLRARGYENLADETPTVKKTYMEIKRKYKGVVYKKRESAASLDTLPDTKTAVEINFFVQKHKCYPKIYVGYDRFSYAALVETALRITIDTNLRSRRNDLGLHSHESDVNYFDQPTFIMEVKTGYGYPNWLLRALSKHRIYPTSFSKYGKIFEKVAGA